MNSQSASLSFPEEIKPVINLSKARYVTVQASEKQFGLVQQHLGKEASTQNFCFARENKTSSLIGGLGFHETSHEGKPLFVLIQTHGEPVGTGCGTEVYKTMTLFDPAGDARLIQRFLDHLTDINEQNEEGTLNVYSWHMKYQYWRRTGSRSKRCLSSIILPEFTKERVLNDLTRFLEPEAKAWFRNHGIPYKRNLLLTGPPGTGKSSFILALASHFDRSICFMQPCDKEMTDENFKAALLKLPTNSVLVLEDIDALFSKNRQRLHHDCPLTFSGFLNGLDGLGSPSGQLIMLTTNHVERLDPALVRAGRVDIRAELPFATRQQLYELFLTFYPDHTTEATRFADTLSKQTNSLSMAGVQNHFIRHRTSTADTASLLTKENIALVSNHSHCEEQTEQPQTEQPQDKRTEHEEEHEEEEKKVDYEDKGKKSPDSESSKRLDVLRDGLGAELILTLLRDALAKPVV